MEGLFVFFWFAVFFFVAYKLGRRRGRPALADDRRPVEGRFPAERSARRPSRAALEAEVDALRERLRVVERIVTERGYTLADEIEALRDARRAEARPALREPEVLP